MPRWMNLMDTVLVATPAAHHRKLRIFHAREDSLPLTILVSAAVFCFFILYISVLLVFFTLVFFFPFFMVASFLVAGALAVVGAKFTFGSFLFVWRKLDRCSSAFLMGVTHANGAAHYGPREDDQDEV